MRAERHAKRTEAGGRRERRTQRRRWHRFWSVRGHFERVPCALGSKWEACVAEEPIVGRRLQNEKLAKALEKTTEFSGREWEAFGLTDLQKNDVIKVGNEYFKLVVKQLKFTRKEWEEFEIEDLKETDVIKSGTNQF